MAQVTGLGGAFLRARNPEALYAWYEKHLGIRRQHGSFTFEKETVSAATVVAFFPDDTDYFGPSGQAAMLNFRVDNLHALLDALQAAGVSVDPNREEYSYGKFGWFTDPEDNRVELWEPLG
jgi:predicted enzyme related to lactoylglutathione lyase